MRRISGIVHHSIQHQRRRKIVDIQSSPSLSSMKTLSITAPLGNTDCMLRCTLCIHFSSLPITSLCRKEGRGLQRKQKPPSSRTCCVSWACLPQLHFVRQTISPANQSLTGTVLHSSGSIANSITGTLLTWPFKCME